MSDTYQVIVSGGALDTLKNASNPAAVSIRLADEMYKQNLITLGLIQRKYMSFPASGPVNSTGVRVISNRLRGSMNAPKPTVSGTEIRGSIGSNVVYARILEEGGVTSAHVIKPKKGKALKFNGIFRRSVNHPGSKFIGRHFVRRGIEERLAEYGIAFSKVIVKGAGQ